MEKIRNSQKSNIEFHFGAIHPDISDNSYIFVQCTEFLCFWSYTNTQNIPNTETFG